MNKLSEMFKKLWAKFNSFTKKIKIAIIVAIITVIVALVSLIIMTTSTKYETLYSNLTADDSATVLAALDQEGV